MSNIVNDTIFAEATAPGKAGVAVIRISGPQAQDIARSRCHDLPDERTMAVRAIRSVHGDVLDHGLVVWFAEKRSFTGEDIVEFHVHGSRAVVQSVLADLASDARLAEAGEFTRRALENGRLDLAQVEALADLIEAETEEQRAQALRQYSGTLAEAAEGWRGNLVRAASLLEATIDFADEEVPVDVSPEVSALVDGVSASLTSQSAGTEAAERVREGFVVAIVGKPNTGKSTLLNALAGREAALTSDVAGTTRDVIEVRMDLGGLPVTLLDTAGIRDADDTVERMGVELATRRAIDADLRVFLLSDKGEAPPDFVLDTDILLLGRADLYGETVNGISGKTGAGIDELISRLRMTLESRAMRSGVLTRQRHKDAVDRAIAHLERARTGLSAGNLPEIIAEDLRSAVRALDSLVGRVDVEQVLDEVFSSFCIGK